MRMSWYQRNSRYLPRKNSKVLLHFGAVDWKADVWVNDVKVVNILGYTPFSFDITLPQERKQYACRKAWDPTDEGYQPSAQVNNPHGICTRR